MSEKPTFPEPEYRPPRQPPIPREDIPDQPDHIPEVPQNPGTPPGPEVERPVNSDFPTPNLVDELPDPNAVPGEGDRLRTIGSIL
jgi:hypothetical protein